MRLDQDSRAPNVSSRLAPHLDLHLVSESQRFDSGVDDCWICAGIDEGSQGHVARDACEAIEVRDGHRRVRLIFTEAASIGLMLSGLLAMRTDTAPTRFKSSTRSAIR